ncbi:MAG: hypothetical protein K1000chlam2_00930 [Chlamydiae bacterium]|nr:hypothetical protein [Chlamydiota bacterium]
MASSSSPAASTSASSALSLACTLTDTKQTASRIGQIKKGLKVAKITTGVLFLTGVTLLAYQVGAIATALLTFPLALIPPIHALTASIGGLIVGGAAGYLAHEKFGQYFFSTKAG